MLLLLALWDDVTSTTIGTTAEWSNKVELADVDGDGWVDILFANGGDYFTGGTPEPERVFKNLGNWADNAAHFEEITTDVFGAAGTRLSRVIKVRDVDGDGDQDIFVGGAHGTRSGLFLRGASGWTDASTQLPAVDVTLGDAELGDVDADGDLDLVLTDWGGDPQAVDGGPTRLWLNDGHGTFTDATAQMPAVLVAMSWDLEVADIDDDADLDVLVSCKLCNRGYAFVNDGSGHFTDDSANKIPNRPNNYEYEPMDIDGDGDLDLVTINDGFQFEETVLANDGTGHFDDVTATALAGDNNVNGADDNVEAFLDVDSDGDADFIIGSLSDADRLLRNDGHGVFTLDDTVMTLSTPGTLGLALADLNHDQRLDVVQSQGEVASPDKVLLANAGVAVDTAAPVVRVLRGAEVGSLRVIARVHDHKSPSAAHDWDAVALEIVGGASTPMTWRGEYLWGATLEGAEAGTMYRVCATDAAGNQACSDPAAVGEGGEPDGGTSGDDDDDGGDDDGGGGGGCCDAGSSGAGSSVLTLLALVGLRRRRR
jgi:hypothetical protein